MSASRIALARGHEVVVAHSGLHEPGDLSVRHLHGERDALLAPGGSVGRARPDVIVGGCQQRAARRTDSAG